jgi:uncharacterized RDD family membrane protein YckC
MALAASYAGFGSRFLSLLIDGILVGIVNAILGVILSNAGSTGSTLAQVVSLVIGIGYQVYFFTSTGQTIGMKVMKIKAVNATGGLLTTGQVIIRAVVSYISAAVILIGFLWMLWDANKQTWHDKAAGSFIVQA